MITSWAVCASVAQWTGTGVRWRQWWTNTGAIVYTRIWPASVHLFLAKLPCTFIHHKYINGMWTFPQTFLPRILSLMLTLLERKYKINLINLNSLASRRQDLSRSFFEMFWMPIPVFIVSFLHLDHRLSPQRSDLPKPFKSLYSHTPLLFFHSIWP